MAERIPRPAWRSAATLLYDADAGRVLAVSRGPDLNNLNLPGGHREAADELPHITAARELIEETGLEAHQIDRDPVLVTRRGCWIFRVWAWGGRTGTPTKEGVSLWVPPALLLRRSSVYREQAAVVLRNAGILVA